MRRAIAEKMTESARTIPHFYLAIEVDGATLSACRSERAADILAATGIPLTLTDLLLMITAHTLARHRAMNASFMLDGIREWDAINLGIAVALDDGLIVPVIHNADRRSLADIVRARADLVERALAGKLAYQDTDGGTFTLSNLGGMGIDFFTSILNPPQAGILSIGALTERPAVVRGALTVRPRMTIGLTMDHRAADGATGARFLADLRARIEGAVLDLDLTAAGTGRLR
jgi:pyruvate dehydrogenase E2 component (dihydrolipoamide acetyltransferase)